MSLPKFRGRPSKNTVKQMISDTPRYGLRGNCQFQEMTRKFPSTFQAKKSPFLQTPHQLLIISLSGMVKLTLRKAQFLRHDRRMKHSLQFHLRCQAPKTLRAKGTLISEPRFSTPCEMRFFPREKGKRPFSKENPRQRPFSLSRVGENASRRG